MIINFWPFLGPKTILEISIFFYISYFCIAPLETRIIFYLQKVVCISWTRYPELEGFPRKGFYSLHQQQGDLGVALLLMKQTLSRI